MISISNKVYNQLIIALRQHRVKEKIMGIEFRYPWIFLLGSKKGVIRKIQRVKTYQEGCFLMVRIDSKELSKSAIPLIRDGYTVVGIARVGYFKDRPNTTNPHYIGEVEDELYRMNPKSILLTVDTTDIYTRVAKQHTPFKITIK